MYRDYNYGAVKVGAIFHGLTLKIKGNGRLDSKWLMGCQCGNEKWMARHEIVSGKRVTCGKCTARKVYRKIKKKENVNANVREHFKIHGFKKVEIRRLGDGAVWWVFRQVGATV